MNIIDESLDEELMEYNHNITNCESCEGCQCEEETDLED